MAEHWIQGAIQHPGSLRSAAKRMGIIKGDESLSEEDLSKLKDEGGVTARRANLAETLKKIRARM